MSCVKLCLTTPGEHNNDVARELGYSDEALKRLRPFAKPDA
ncbi:hypothetical protein OAD94_07210 [Amylibacter sp.]|nr:hypothetical protein [Amylibacter sp.]